MSFGYYYPASRISATAVSATLLPPMKWS